MIGSVGKERGARGEVGREPERLIPCRKIERDGKTPHTHYGGVTFFIYIATRLSVHLQLYP
jgi:hypothetical protein